MQVPGCEDILPEALSFCVQFLRQHGFGDAEAALMTELEERILLSSQQQPASEEDVSEPADADSESAAAESQAEGDKPRLSSTPVGAEWDRSSALSDEPAASAPKAETKAAPEEEQESSGTESGSNRSASAARTEEDADREGESDTYPSASDRGQPFSKETTPPDGYAESDEYEDEDDSGYLRLEITNVASFFSREMMTSPDDAFRFPYGTSPMASPASTPARSPAPGSPAASGANQAFADARMRGLSLEDALAAGAAVGPEVVEEACVVNSPTSARAHLASDDAEADAEEGQDSVPAELGSGGKGKGGLLSGSASLSRPLAHETSLGGWNSLGDMLAHDSSAEKQQQQQQHAVQEGGEGEAKEPSTPEPMRARPSDGPEGHSSGGVPGPGGPGFTFSAPETASPPMLAAFGWSPTAQKDSESAAASRLDAGTPPLVEGSAARSGGHLTDPDSEAGGGAQEAGGSGKTTPCSSPRPPPDAVGAAGSATSPPGGEEAAAEAADARSGAPFEGVLASDHLAAAAAAAAAAAVKAIGGAESGLKELAPSVLVAAPVSVVREGTDAVATPRTSQTSPPVAWDDDVEHFEQAYEVFDLRVVHRRNRTGFEEEKDFPIRLNSIVAGRYQVMEYLGSAAFSKAVQALDLQTGMLVCMKIIKNSKDFFDQSLDEIKLLKFLNRHDPRDDHGVLRLYDYFYFKEHLFIVCELLRANLYEFQRYNRDSGDAPYFALPRLQSIAKQVLRSLGFMHSLGLLHCDLKPENILIQSYSRCLVKVIDVGSSCFITDHLSSYVQSRSYRAPEVILGHPYDHRIDIWSLGCIMAELWTGNVLFQNDSLVTLLARVIGIVGPFPNRMLANSRHVAKYFTKTGELYEREDESGRGYVLRPKQCGLRHRLAGADRGFVDFVSFLLTIDPLKRPTAEQALQHPWLSQPYEEVV